jgi:hypothetical protein
MAADTRMICGIPWSGGLRISIMAAGVRIMARVVMGFPVGIVLRVAISPCFGYNTEMSRTFVSIYMVYIG